MRTIRDGALGSKRAMRGALPLVLALGLFGCDDFLTTEPKAQLTTANFFTTEEQAKQATNATYSMLRNWTTHVLFWVGLTDIISDDATKGSTPTDAGYLIPVEDLNLDAGNTALQPSWTGYYQGIYRANIAIANIPGIDMNASLRDQLVAENKFLRAYYYFFLVRGFGGVPLITDPLDPDEYFQPRASADAVFAQIEQDLTEAIPALPERSEQSASDVGRVTAGAAHGLLAQVHLFQGEYADALEHAQAVIQSGQYSLYPDYAGIFRFEGENSSESVFEIQALAQEGGNNSPSGPGVQYPVVQGVRGQPNLGWGFNTPSPDLEASYEPGDPRLQATIMYPWELHPYSSPVLVYLNPQMLNNRYNQKVTQPVDNPGGPGNSGVNIRRIRYADVLLIGAEAASRTGNEGQARTWLNMVRDRARGGMDVTLGLQAEALSNEIAEDVLGLTTSSRVFVRYVGEETEAFTAGVRGLESDRDDSVGPIPVRMINLDVITAINGTPVTDLASYRSIVSGFGAGGMASLDITRVTHPEGGAPTTSTLSVTVPVMALLPDVTAGGSELLTAIWEERRHELALEQHRWFDLIRQGRAASVMNALTCQDRAQPAGCTSINFQEGKHEQYPIPLGEVTIAGLEQNPGY